MTLKKEGTTADITVSKNIDSVVDQIKSFVEQYNTIMTDVGTKLNEKRYRTYNPLTDEQKSEMKEEDIKKWEEKALSIIHLENCPELIHKSICKKCSYYELCYIDEP